jgi:hypothetical protein
MPAPDHKQDDITQQLQNTSTATESRPLRLTPCDTAVPTSQSGSGASVMVAVSMYQACINHLKPSHNYTRQLQDLKTLQAVHRLNLCTS